MALTCARYFLMSTTLPGGPLDLDSCSNLVRCGLELDFFNIPLAGGGASKLGFRSGLF